MNHNVAGNDFRRQHWLKAFSILIPVTVQHMISFGLNIVDTLMIGRVGTDELAAVGAANQIYGVFVMICFGFLSGGGVYIAQYWGVKDLERIRHTLGLIYKNTLLFGTIIVLLVQWQPEWIIGLFIREDAVVILGVDYIRIASLSYLVTALSFSMSFSSRCIQRLRWPTTINALALITNTVLNYVLIYGKLGFPIMGVKGAALATLIARTLEFLLMIAYLYGKPGHPLAARFSELTGYSKAFRNQIYKTAGPIVLSDGAYGVAASIFLSGFGIIGSVAVAAYQVVHILGEFSQSIFYGLGNASAVLLGEKLGRGDIKGAGRDARGFLWFGLGLISGITVLLLLVNPHVPGWYDFDASTVAVLAPALTVSALTVWGRALTYLFICGVLRSGGDTRYVMFVDIGWTWLFGIPVMFVGILFFDFVLWQAALVRFLSECIKAVQFYFRYRTKKWQNVLTEARPDPVTGTTEHIS
ncbi:MAG: MATE family efflux transporter [Clostridiales bacterium]|nr:MATE family efflux transporter [Clostridiales bacterium]HPF19665.1 MATE family efflux transporter [Bacillota bacterium]